MQIKDMFEKQIDRDIKGVIKVGQSDEENVYQELDEYVVTKELLKHFRDFFENYEKAHGLRSCCGSYAHCCARLRSGGRNCG